MRKLFIQFHGVVMKDEGNTGELNFTQNVIHSLYQLNKNCGFELSFIVDENLKEAYKKAMGILESEEIKFSIVNNYSETAQGYIVRKKGTGFEILLGNKILFKPGNWNQVTGFFKSALRKILYSRKTNETEIDIELNPDGTGVYNISTGLGFFNHMLEQFSKHSLIDLSLNVKGDLQIDEHHTIEDTAIALGEAINKSLSDKKGIERYGFLLPMDDCLAQVAIDFGGRSWLVWEVDFKREKIGDVPTEMFYHFFKSFSDAAKCNLNIKAEGTNEHHKIESVFKAFAKAVKMAVAVDYESDVLPTTKGIL